MKDEKTCATFTNKYKIKLLSLRFQKKASLDKLRIVWCPVHKPTYSSNPALAQWVKI